MKQTIQRAFVLFPLFAVVLTLCLFDKSSFAQENRIRRTESQKEVQTVPAEPQTLDVIKVDSNLVSVPVIVSDREGRYIPNLTAESFKLFDNSTEQRISYFDAAEEPLNIALLLDTSRSTEGALDDIRKAAKSFLKELRPQDRAMVVSFDYEIHKLSELTADRKALEKAIKEAKVGKFVGTTLNDAVLQVTRNELRPITGRKAIILLSDGQDFGSMASTEDLLAEESESDAMVYSIYYAPQLRGFPGRMRPGRLPDRTRGRFPGGIFGPRFPLTTDQWQRPRPGGQRPGRFRNGAEILQKLSEVTSGRFYQSQTTDLKQTFDLIAEELRHQYRLGFYPGELQKDGSLHQLRVTVSAGDVAVRARKQYRARNE